MKKAFLYNLSFFFLFVSSVIIFPAKVNGQQWTQVQRFGSADVYEIANSVALDAAGNAYITGHVNNVVDFGTGPLNTGIYGQAYIAKYSAAGVCLWVTRMNCPENPSSPYPLRPEGMAIATNGTSVYVTGTYGNCLTVNGAPSISGNTAFGLKLDAATGNAQWLTGF